ncbi:MAG: rRNA maturation RNase YbeY [Candidatus Nealsonbacteria bacterium]|nr:rRNA maturation RNase YbeY [Candidatus Nealsonbacteria bacterium]
MEISITNLSGIHINRDFVKEVSFLVLDGIDKDDVSIVFSDSEFIKEINKKYRNKDKVTDVLSFPESVKGFKGVSSSLGEIIICPLQLKQQAKEQGVSFKEELARILIHGLLHLLGYDHEISKKEEIKMKEREEYFLSLVLRN